jgi:hypothetical protein
MLLHQDISVWISKQFWANTWCERVWKAGSGSAARALGLQKSVAESAVAQTEALLVLGRGRRPRHDESSGMSARQRVSVASAGASRPPTPIYISRVKKRTHLACARRPHLEDEAEAAAAATCLAAGVTCVVRAQHLPLDGPLAKNQKAPKREGEDPRSN